jgi:biotin carboxyl carrier protein
VTVGGRTVRVDAYQHQFGTLSLLVDTASYTATLDRRDPAVHVRVRNGLFPIEILDERRLRMRRAASRFTVEGRQVVCAPMPGRIVRVLVAAGDEVREGQGLVVVEAMKMENEMRSPKGGRVVEVHVREGQAVENGAKLVAVE